VASLSPPSGIGALVAALDAHRAGLDHPAARVRARRRGAVADFAAEHGERGLRALGGRRAAERRLEDCDPGLGAADLLRALEAEAGTG
jgi:LAO/AO transport system kinase